MKKKFTDQTKIPEGISCELSGSIIKCTKGSLNASREITNPLIKAKLDGDNLILSCEKGNKNEFKSIKSLIAHMENIFSGLEKPFVYRLEACNVHFPMTLKVESDKLVISNFLGEKTPRFAKILPGVTVEAKGQKITISSVEKEAAGQTAANLEKATRIRNRDRRIFQDGIFITERPGEGAQ